MEVLKGYPENLAAKIALHKVEMRETHQAIYHLTALTGNLPPTKKLNEKVIFVSTKTTFRFLGVCTSEKTLARSKTAGRKHNKI